jgi:hypothetical protein
MDPLTGGTKSLKVIEAESRMVTAKDSGKWEMESYCKMYITTVTQDEIVLQICSTLCLELTIMYSTLKILLIG